MTDTTTTTPGVSTESGYGRPRKASRTGSTSARPVAHWFPSRVRSACGLEANYGGDLHDSVPDGASVHAACRTAKDKLEKAKSSTD